MCHIHPYMNVRSPIEALSKPSVLMTKNHSFPTAVQTLPDSYAPVWYLDMRERQSLIIGNIAGLALLVSSAWGFSSLAFLLRPDAHISISVKGISGWLIILALIVATVLMVTIHEGFHGICFWIFTRTRPQFALRQFYAYAAAVGWYLPKGQYMVTALAPLIGMSLLGMLIIMLGPASLILPVLVILIFNASGAAGDLWVAGALLFRSPDTYVHDQGDRIEFYGKQRASIQ